MKTILYVMVAAIALCSHPVAIAETVVLKSGDTVEGKIVRTVGSNVTIRTASGFSTYHVNELDQAWLDENHGTVFTKVREKSVQRGSVDEVVGLVALARGLTGKDSLSKATPFLAEHQRHVLSASAVLISIGLALCFFGWRLFKFSTILGGILSGIMLGLCLSGIIAGLVYQAMPEDMAQWGAVGVFLISGIPFAIIGAKFGRRFAMFGARYRTLQGIGAGWLSSIFSLTRFAFFDLSVIWGHALFGAVLIAVGLYCAAVPLLELPDKHLQPAFFTCIAVAVLVCVFGAVAQIKSLRSEQGNGYRGEY